jgi:uncharacterized protein involved in outer membrane biogenesis
MKKALKIILVAVPMVIIVAVLVIFFSLNSIVKAGVETVGPKVTGTAVTLDKVGLSPLSGRGALAGLRVGNPEGFTTESAFELGEVRVNVSPKSLLSDTIVIEEIVVASPKVTFEGDISGSNIGRIRKNVEAFSSSAAPSAESKPSAQEGDKKGKKVEIGRFVFKDGSVQLAAAMLKGQSATVPLPDIELRDIGKDSGGATLATVVEELFPAIYKAIIETVASSGEVLEKAAQELEDSARKVRDQAEGEASKMLKDVKGIFDR